MLKLSLLVAIAQAQLWGTYKPNLYFALKDVEVLENPI